MKKFYIEAGEELDLTLLAEVLQEYNTAYRPALVQAYKYYNGEHQILKKRATDIGKPCNKIITNFINEAVNTYEGFGLGIPVAYTSANVDVDITPLTEVLKYNDVVDADSDWYRNGLIYGIAYELSFIDEYGIQHIKQLEPENAIPIYDNTLLENLRYFIRYYPEITITNNLDQETYIVEVWDEKWKTTYRANSSFASFEFLNAEVHHYSKVPVSIFYLNDEEEPLTQQVWTLQDSYNTLFSASIDNFEAFCDSYLVLKGVQADAEDLAAMKENRCLMIDSDCSADYLIKQTNTTEIQNLLLNTEEKIHQLIPSPKFTDESFGTASGVAIKYRLIGFTNRTKSILNNFKKALKNRVELICQVLSLVDETINPNDININFTLNFPVDYTEQVNLVNSLRGVVSQETLLAQLPFIENPKDEVEKVKEESSYTLASYDFGSISSSDEEELDEE